MFFSFLCIKNLKQCCSDALPGRGMGRVACQPLWVNVHPWRPSPIELLQIVVVPMNEFLGPIFYHYCTPAQNGERNRSILLKVLSFTLSRPSPNLLLFPLLHTHQATEMKFKFGNGRCYLPLCWNGWTSSRPTVDPAVGNSGCWLMVGGSMHAT